MVHVVSTGAASGDCPGLAREKASSVNDLGSLRLDLACDSTCERKCQPIVQRKKHTLFGLGIH
jgi:hypothetical protein